MPVISLITRFSTIFLDKYRALLMSSVGRKSPKELLSGGNIPHDSYTAKS